MTADEKTTLLALDQEEFEEPEPPGRSPRRTSGRRWQPRLGPIGTNVLLDTTKYILLHGERGSGKSSIALNVLALHLYNNWNAGAMMVALTRTSATEGGTWEKFNTLTLPEWFDGIGLDFMEPKQDDQKNRYVFVANKFDGWSKVILRSMPHGTNIAARMKGPEPSLFFFDELAETDNRDYFLKPIQQLGRRPKIKIQQYIATANPSDEGEDHWVYQQFFVAPQREDGTTDPDFAVYHIPFSENVWWPEEQRESFRRSLILENRYDPTATERTIGGKWIKRPTGTGLFADSFSTVLHVKGDARSGMGLAPLPGFPIWISYDLGPRYSCATFEQFIPKEDGGVIVLIFDELDLLDKKVFYKQMAKELVVKIKHWFEVCKCQFQVLHCSDDSAIIQRRAGSESREGSYDSWCFEQEFNRVWPERKMRMQAAPKGKGSVQARVNCVTSKLMADELWVSAATCPNTIMMFRTLSEDKDNPGHPAKGRMIHKFDSVSYGMFKMETGGYRKLLQSRKVSPTLIQCGVRAR